MTDQNSETDTTQKKSATAIISLFGGIRPMAKKLGVAVTTVQGWKERGVIPEARHEEVLRAAERFDVSLTLADLQGDTGEDATWKPEPEAAAPMEDIVVSVAADETTTEPQPEPPPQDSLQDKLRRQLAALPQRVVLTGFAIGAVLLVVSGVALWQWSTGTGAPPEAEVAGKTEPQSGGGETAETPDAPVAPVEPVPSERPRKPAAAAELDELRARLDALIAALKETEQRIGAIEARGAAGDSQADPSEAEAALRALAARVEAIEGRAGPAGGGDAAALMELERRLAKLEAEKPAEDKLEALSRRIATLETAPAPLAAPPRDTSGAALLLAVGQLREAARGSGSFRAEFEAVQSLASGDEKFEEALTPLTDLADRGIATVAMLRERFGPMAGAVVQASRMPENPRWYEKALFNVTSLVNIRRTGEVQGDDPEARVALAELSLAKDDLAGAVAILSDLAGHAAEAAKSWLSEAKNRLAAENSLKDLQALAIAELQSAADQQPDSENGAD